MDNHLKKSQIEITDLVNEAVVNATARRNLAEMNELLVEESKNIHGGKAISSTSPISVSPAIAGGKPIITGLIQLNSSNPASPSA
jgi:hypothetical protein